VRPFATGDCSYNSPIYTVLSIIPRRGGTWVEVLASGAEPLRLPLEAQPAWLRVGAQIEAAQWRELTRESEAALLMARALRLLERREHFESELRRKLFKPGQDERLTQRVLARCRELGYLDDARALRMALELFAARGGIGPLRLRQLLFERGCPAPLVERAVVEFSAHFDEGAEARALLDKKRRHFALRLAQLRRRLEARRLKAQALTAGSEESADLETEADARKLPAPARQDALLLRQQLAASVLAFLSLRGLSGEAGRRQARQLVEELLESESPEP